MEKAYSLDEALTISDKVERLVLKYGNNEQLKIDSRIEKLDNLREVYIEDFNQAEFYLPAEIANLKKLETFSFQFSQHLESLPKRLFEIETLKSINIAGLRKIKQLDDEITKLKKLTVLVLGFELNHIPKGLLSMESLLGLTICFGVLSDKKGIDKDFGNGLSNLVSLDLIIKNIIDIPLQFYKSKKYQSIKIDCENGAGNLKFDFINLKELKRLALTRFSSVDKSVSVLNNLHTLNLYSYKGERLDIDFTQMTSLEFIELENSLIIDLPKSIGKADNLKRILLRNSKIQYFPIELASNNRLKGIDLQDCENLDFESLFEVVKNSESINWLSLKGTNLTKNQISKINNELKNNK